MKAFQEKSSETLKRLGVNPDIGLSSEAVEESRRKNGVNAFTPRKPKSVFKKIWDAATEPMIIMLLAAAAITLGVNFVRYFTGGETEFIECIGIFAAIFLAVGVTVIMEGKSEKAFEALNKINEDIQVKVLRNGAVTQISQRDLVVGDIMEVATGDMIPADGRLVEAVGIRVNESSLTGESMPVKKSAEAVFDDPKTPVAERANMLYSGCFVTAGSGTLVVTEVGDGTEFGSIARELSATEKGSTPLQEKMDRLGKFITVLGATAAAIVFTIQLIIFISTGTFNLDTVSEAFITSIVLIVAAVPEGLPTIVAVSLSINIIKMARQNALVKKLIACETVGAINVICSDKTGTLTENRMTVTDIYENGRLIAPGQLTSPTMIQNFAVNSTADIERGENPRFIGNPTEGALLMACEGAEACDRHYADIRKSAEIVYVYPFSSETKNMTTLVQEGGETVVYTKGSPEKILSLCTKKRDDGGVSTLEAADIEVIEAAIVGFEKQAKRVLAFAYKEMPELSGDADFEESRASFEEDLICDGFVAITDPLREDVRAAVKRCREAGIELKILTGDNIVTARAIADELNLLAPGDAAAEAHKLEDLSEERLIALLPKIKVIARSTPTVKMRVVNALKKMGNTVAVTGDGINDAPAIKNADVGIAMGITGTEVSKEASDIVLLDDSFSTIVKAVQWGRGIYENFQRFIQFQLTVNLSSVIVVLCCILMGLKSPFTALQLLWINIIMDGPPALTLGLEPIREDLLKHQPISRDSNIVNKGMLGRIGCVGIFVSFVFMMQALFNILGGRPEEQYTILFTLFVVMHLFNAFNCRELSDTSIFSNIFNNHLMLGVFGATFLLQVVITQFGGVLYNTVPLSLAMWIKIVILGMSVIVVAEIFKLIKRKLFHR